MAYCEILKLFKGILVSIHIPTVTVDKVSLMYVEPGVLYGYRLEYQTVIYYLKSIFQFHNETVNIWTHLVPFIFVFLKTYNCITTLEDATYICVLLCFAFGTIMYTLFSVLAHTLHSKSPIYHYTCYTLDYMGIGYYALGACILVYYCSCHEKYYAMLEHCFLPVVVVMSWLGFLCCTISKLRYRRPYPFQRKLWNICSFGFQCVLVYSVVNARYYDSLMNNTLSSPNHHTLVFVYILVSVFFFSSHIPEKFYPGKFDFIGQGHQIFHIMVSLGTLEQFNAAMIDIRYQTPLLINHKPRADHIVLSLLAYTVMALITIYFFGPTIQNRVKEDVELEQMRKK
ncbi:membrane progestin receptor beta-like [Mytilus californianus]|uniref:membrane progestin receptor beta-like n=1 Tax=Mytilus californianus TaxID=6549 RepID=UPI002246675A|nr:membrane progestin receptor beta-like [Mytilus californianus]